MENAPAIIPPISEETRKAWLSMATAKAGVVQGLQKYELDSQSILLEIAKSDDLKIIQDRLAEYRKLHLDASSFRISFTSKIDKGIILPLMEYEKKIDPKNNVEYDKQNKRFIQLRIEDEQKSKDVALKVSEVARFKTHFENEYHKIAADFKYSALCFIGQKKKEALDLSHPIDAIDLYITLVKVELEKIEKGKPSNFTPLKNSKNENVISLDEMKSLFAAVPKPDWEKIYIEMRDKCDETFSMYAQELEVPESAGAASVEDFLTQAEEIRQESIATQAVNTLINNAAASVVVDINPGVKALVRKEKIVIIESPEFAQKVIAAFLKDWGKCTGKLTRLTKWSNLSLSQMVNSLDAAEIRVPGLEYQEIIK